LQRSPRYFLCRAFFPSFTGAWSEGAAERQEPHHR
jgi:hypothetical protein